jgi:beta-lactamase regulating signal transducer with metallopeptidase domain
MNGLGEALGWSSIAVTLMVSTALILERVASRRGPRAGSWVAVASLWLIIILTLIAFCPLPSSLAWRSSGGPARSGSPSLGISSMAADASEPLNRSNAAVVALSQANGHSGFWWRSFSKRLSAGLASGTVSIGQRNLALPRGWWVFFVAGTSFSLVRLLIGLWGVRDCRRTSLAISEPDVLALVDWLRIELGVRRVIEVRELPGTGLATAVAVGWRRPLVLLPGDWRNWNISERHAVLAHEVAHIARADYQANVMARFGLAIHFYHPLVHWMVRRLQLQQELAADAQGARLAGGRRAYLLALSRLALGMEKSRLVWPATAFLRTEGHLIRRIHVLKQNNSTNDGPMPTAARVVTIALLASIGLGAAALRGLSPIQGAEASQGADKSVPNPAVVVSKTSKSQSFDLTYLPPKALGFVVFRPAAIAQLPACRPDFDRLNGLLAKELFSGMPKIEAIEQAAFEFSVRPRDKSKNQPGRIMTGTWMLRTVDDFDWKTAMKALFKRFDKTDLDLVEVRFAGKVYYKAAKSQYPRPFGPDSFYLPDSRTIVWDYENNLRLLIGQVKRTGPEFVGADDWRKVDSGLFAMAIDTRDQHWKLDVGTDEPPDLPFAPLLEQPNRWVLGIDSADLLTLRAIAACGTDTNGQLIERTVASLLARARVALGERATRAPKGELADLEAGGMRLANDFVQASMIHREGSAVDIIATAKASGGILMKLIIMVIAG